MCGYNRESSQEIDPGSIAEQLNEIDVPPGDTVKRVPPGSKIVESTVVREELVAVQTPQGFRADWLRRAHAEVGRKAYAPDDAALVEALGLPVEVVPGQRDNLKVTTAGDLELAGFLLGRRKGGES